jgi:AraC-like DNA-binding protein
MRQQGEDPQATMKPKAGLVTVSVRSVRPVLEHLRTLGLDVATVLAGAGADPGALEDPDARIPHELAIAVWREAVARSGDAAFGIHAAEQIRPGAFDVLDYAIRSSATLGDGLERLVRYHRIWHDAAIVRLVRDGRRATLTHALPGDPIGLPRHAAEFIVAGWVVVARQATGVDFEPLEVTFRHASPSDIEEHRRFFRAPIRFESPTMGVSIRSEMLDAPLVKADPGLGVVLDRHVRELFARVPNTTTLCARVREIVAGELSTGPPSASAVARRLHMSRRTLQRRLGDEGTTHRELVETLRRDLAARYLAERRLAVAEIAFLLGFSEESAFHRAFKRWHGCTPATYRRSR